MLKQIKGGIETTKKGKKFKRQAFNPFGHFQRDTLAVGAAKTPPFFDPKKVSKWVECLPFLLFSFFCGFSPALNFFDKFGVCVGMSSVVQLTK